MFSAWINPNPPVENEEEELANKILEDVLSQFQEQPEPPQFSEDVIQVSVNSMLAAARSQLGYREGSNNDSKFGKWYGLNYEPWCVMFLAWCGNESNEAKAVGRFSYSPVYMKWFQDSGLFGTTPRRGAVVFFRWKNTAAPCAHVGIVEEIESGGTIKTIEGNSGDKVKRNRWHVNDSRIVGYGYPQYAGGKYKEPFPYPGTLVRRGNRGNVVVQIQSRLIFWRFLQEVPRPDGIFGPNTETAVKNFQRYRELTPDGIVGPRTWERLFRR